MAPLPVATSSTRHAGINAVLYVGATTHFAPQSSLFLQADVLRLLRNSLAEV